MNFKRQHKAQVITGLDIESGSVAATETRLNGSVEVTKTALEPLDPGIVRDGEVIDAEALGEALEGIFSEHDLTTTVRLGIANQRVAVRTLRMPLIEKPDELETAVRFQATEHLPMPLEEAAVAHQVVGHAQHEGEHQMDVIVVAARSDMVGKFLAATQRAGLKPAGIDLSAFGMIRALWPEIGPAEAADGPEEEPALPGARLYCGIGSVTNLAVARGDDCLFTRISTYGTEAMAQALAERAGLTLEHARQWIHHVGLKRPIGEIEGDPEKVSATREVLAEGAAKLADELRLSLEFYGAQEGAVPIEGIVACGPGSSIAGLGERLHDELGYDFDVKRPRALSHLDDAAAARLTLSYGLAAEKA